MNADAIKSMICRILDSPEGPDLDPSDIVGQVLSAYMCEDAVAFIDRESARRWPPEPVPPDPSDLAIERAERRAAE